MACDPTRDRLEGERALDPRVRCRQILVAELDSMQLSVGTPPRLWLTGRVRPQIRFSSARLQGSDKTKN